MQDDSFIQAILSAPLDDAPRLIYADWLDERGDVDRAEFIRVQCRLAQTRDADPAHDELIEAERSLLARHGEEWAEKLLKSSVYGGDRTTLKYQYRRGLLEHVAVRSEELAGRLDELFESAPSLTSLLVRRFTLDEAHRAPAAPPRGHEGELDARSYMRAPARIAEQLAAHPRAPQLTELSLHGLDRGKLNTLLESPAVGRLRALDLTYGDFGGPGVIALARSERLRNLERLTLHNIVRRTPLTRESIAALVDERSLPALRTLDVSQNFLSDSLAEMLLNGRLIRRLDELNISANEINDHVLASAADHESVPTLRTLKLNALHDSGVRSNERITPEGVRELFRWAPELTRLDMNGNRFESAGAVVIAERVPEGLTELVLNGCGVQDHGAAALAGSPRLTNLRRLELDEPRSSNAKISAEGARTLAGSPGLANLRELNLQGNPIRDEGATWIARSRWLTNLRELNLGQAEIGSNGLAALAASPSLATLRSLRLYANGPFDEAALKALCSSPHLAKLRTLGMGWSRFVPNGTRGGAASADPVEQLLRRAFGERVHFL